MSRPGKPTAGEGRKGVRGSILDRAWVAPVALLALTVLAYARSLGVPILGWDDDVYLFRDVRLAPLTAESLWKILTQPFFANFHPVTTLTFALDRALYGTWVPGFHITQLAFYLAGVAVVYFLFQRLLDWRAGALAAAALFAVHPVHVESVAWLASRKDVVCLVFYTAALLAYVEYARSEGRRAWGAYAAALLLSAAAMLSKGYAVILPAAFVAYDLCFAGRITRRRVLDKIPFAAVAAWAVLLTVRAQDRDSALVRQAFAVGDRLWQLAKVFAQYVAHTLVPVRLSAFYTSGVNGVVDAGAVLGAILLVALVAAFLALRRSRPEIAFGIALFLLPLATVMNMFFTLRIWMADRYLFLPTIGSSLALVALAAPRASRKGGPRGAPRRGASTGRILAAVALIAVALYAALTVARIGVWTSRVSLWSDTLRAELRLGGSGPVTAADLARAPSLRAVEGGPLGALAEAYEAEGNAAEAAAVRALTEQAGAQGDVSGELAAAQQDIDAGRYDDAMRRLRPLAEGTSWIAPQATILIGALEDRRGNAEASSSAFQRAIEQYREQGQPASEALLAIGTTLFLKRDYARALQYYTRAYRESPDDAKAAFHLGRALEESGDLAGALRLYERIARGELPILPQSGFTVADVLLQTAAVESRLGRDQDAIRDFGDVLRRAPNHPQRAGIEAEIARLRTLPPGTGRTP
jgi:tetratricopeptide (TPR) repeat protein